MNVRLRLLAAKVGFGLLAVGVAATSSAAGPSAPTPAPPPASAPASSSSAPAAGPSAPRSLSPGPAAAARRGPVRPAVPLALRAVVPSGPPPRIMPVSQIRAGMVGEAHTVFRGTKPEPFKVRVVSVVHNFLPKQDVILVKAEDPRVEFSGIAAGMSGSPVYIDGKLIGAVAYAWAFAKEPLAGVTPIESMLAERSRPRRTARGLVEAGELVQGPAPQPADLSLGRPAQAAGDAPAAADDGTEKSAGEAGSGGALPEGGQAGAGRSLGGGGLSALGPASPDGLRPVSVPLSISGLSQHALGELTTALEPYGLVPVRTGGGGGGGPLPSADQRTLVPGSAVGVQLIRGDMNATAVGTVTWVSGDSLIAFGHPMFGVGEVNLPLVTGEVHTFINSQASSFKLATPLAEVGAVVQDRPSCIVGDLGLRATMMPVEVRVTAPGAEPRIFRAEVARNRRLTPILASAVLTTAIADAEPDQTEMAVSLTTRMGVRGLGPVELRDQVWSSEGLSPRALGSLRGVRAIGDLLGNPFEPVGFEKLEFEVRIEFRRDFAEIVSVALPSDEIRAGDSLPLRVTLRPYAGREYVETVKVAIPERLAGQSVRLEVAAGSMVRPETPRAETLAGFVENLRSYYTASSIVVSLSLPEDGASLRGHLIPSLPPSALDTLRTASQTRRADAYRLADRTVFPSPRLVSGRQELIVQIREDSLGRNQ